MTSLDASQSTNHGLPSRVFTSRGIAEKALERIGAYTPMDGEADAEELRRALEWMEIVVANLTGQERLQWLIPATVEFDLEDDTASYLLSDVAGSSFPSRRVAYIISAKLKDSGGAEYDLDVIRRSAYEDIVNKDDSGPPSVVYIDRSTDDPTIYVHRVPSSSDTVRSVRLVVQTYAPSVLSDNADPDQAGERAHGFDSTWQLWLIDATAAQIGNGPVRRLPKSTLVDIREQADINLVKLMGHQNRENQSIRLRRTRRYGGG